MLLLSSLISHFRGVRGGPKIAIRLHRKHHLPWGAIKTLGVGGSKQDQTLRFFLIVMMLTFPPSKILLQSRQKNASHLASVSCDTAPLEITLVPHTAHRCMGEAPQMLQGPGESKEVEKFPCSVDISPRVRGRQALLRQRHEILPASFT